MSAPRDASVSVAEMLGERTDLLLRSARSDAPTFADCCEELAALGVAKGSGIFISAPNPVLAVRLFLSSVALGLIPCLVSPITTADRLSVINKHLHLMGTVRIAPPSEHRPGGPSIRLERFERPARRFVPGSTLMLTSGTSGVSTGVLHSLEQLERNARRHTSSLGLTTSDQILAVLPVYYSFGLVAQIIAPLALGVPVTLSHEIFSPAAFVGDLRACGANVSAVTPRMAAALVNTDRRSLERLRVLSVGGQSCPPDVTGSLLRGQRIPQVFLTYGLTEAGPRVATLSAHAESEQRWASIGIPLDNTTLGVDAIQGESVLTVTSDTVATSYLGRFDPTSIDAKGHRRLLTGDVVRQDEDGYFSVIGRRSDIVVIGGEKILLSDVRSIAESVLGVARATVTARTSEGEPIGLRMHLWLRDDTIDPVDVRRAIGRRLRAVERPSEVTTEVLGDNLWVK